MQDKRGRRQRKHNVMCLNKVYEWGGVSSGGRTELWIKEEKKKRRKEEKKY